MRTSLAEIELIDNWLLSRDDPQAALLVQARLVLDDDFNDKIDHQKAVHELVNLYGRQKLRKEIEAVESRLLASRNHRSFQDRIKSIFKF